MRRRHRSLFLAAIAFLGVTSVVFVQGAVNTRNVATYPLNEAENFTKNFIFKNLFPNFAENYSLLQEKCRVARNISRIDMPVIHIGDIAEFQRKLENGFIDILPPYSDKHEKDSKTGEPIYFPKDLKADEKGRQWLEMGKADGDIDDDKVFAQIEYIMVKDLLPVQSQIWLEVINNSVARWGAPKEGSSGLEATIIVSKEGYILDGHHRFATALLVNPNLKTKCLKINLDIKTLLKMGRSYGNAIGNKQNQ
ncbi:hypothetical protein KKA53_03290 [Candidatus Dependentiae bacterium]|nr:hypothetical protein [Candidatus Dependentiae bacterium]